MNKLFETDEIFDEGTYKYIVDTHIGIGSTCRTDFAIIVDGDMKNTDIGVISGHNLIKSHYKLNDPIFKGLAKPSRGKGSRFYVTHNPVVAWTVGDTGRNRTKFALNRIKYNYTVYFTSKTGQRLKVDIPGEVLDLSHAHNSDRKKVKYDKNISALKFLQRFRFLNNDLTYLSYSLYGHISDISDIIFFETEHKPWTDKKYAKRIQRIIIIACLLYFNHEGLGTYDNKLTNLQRIIDAIVIGYMDDNNITGHTVLDMLIQDIIHSINNGNDQQVQEYKETCLNNFENMLKAFQAQLYYTRNQVLSYARGAPAGYTGILNLPLNLDYPGIY